LTRRIISVSKYLLSLFVAIALLYYVFRGWNFDDVIERFAKVNYSWVFLSVFLSLVSHLLRAYRWNLLLEPVGFSSLSTFRTFKAVMIGYLTNLIAPRLGEITRCGVLKRTDGVNMSASIGTVVAERIFDFLGLLSLIVLALMLEFDHISTFFIDFINDKFGGINLTTEKLWAILIIGFILAGGLMTLWWFRERIKRKPFYYKLRSFIREMISGFTSVLRLEKKVGFWLSTVFIWVLYYVMAYVLFFSVESTSNLGLTAGLSILIMGGLGMSAPVQGGFGTYHILVGSILLTYGIAEKDGFFFATLVHTSQTLSVMVFGGISLLLTLPNKKKNNRN
jgi:glycosyltransferase 2 family protein